MIPWDHGIMNDTADTVDYVKHRLQSKFGERCFSYAGPAAWNSLLYLTASSSSRTDTSRFKQLVKSHLFRIAFWHFVSAPGQFVSRALQVRICICICICMVHGYKHSFTYCRVNNFSDDSHRTTSMYTQTVVPLVTAHKGALFRPRRSRTHTQISV